MDYTTWRKACGSFKFYIVEIRWIHKVFLTIFPAWVSSCHEKAGISKCTNRNRRSLGPDILWYLAGFHELSSDFWVLCCQLLQFSFDIPVLDRILRCGLKHLLYTGFAFSSPSFSTFHFFRAISPCFSLALSRLFGSVSLGT